MSLRSQVIHIAAKLPQGDPTKRKLLASLKSGNLGPVLDFFQSIISDGLLLRTRANTRDVFVDFTEAMAEALSESLAKKVKFDSEHLEAAEAVWSTDFLRDGDGFDYLEARRYSVTLEPVRSVIDSIHRGIRPP